MSRVRPVLRVLLPIVVVAAAAGGAMVMVRNKETPQVPPPVIPVPLVQTVTATAATYVPMIHASGSVTAAVEGELVSEVQGRVLEIGSGILVGARFRAGDLLVRIDPRDYELAVVEAEAAVAQAALAMELEKAEADAAAKGWASMHPDQPPSALVLREPQLAETSARLAAARARLESSKRDLERTTLRAPWDGFTFEKSVDLGQFVTRGTRLAHLFGRSAVEIRLPLEQEELARLDLDHDDSPREVDLRAEINGRSVVWRGRVVRRDDWLDPRSRLASIVVRVEDPFTESDDHPAMYLNLFVHAELKGRPVPGGFTLPRAALRPGNRMFVVDRDSRLRIRQVQLVVRERDTVVVGGELADGDLVCITPLDLVTDGMPVRVDATPVGEAR